MMVAIIITSYLPEDWKKPWPGLLCRPACPTFRVRLGLSSDSVPLQTRISVCSVQQPREGTMRDIRGDLQERAILVDEQIRTAAAHFDKAIQKLQTERDARIADLKAGLAMIAKFMEFEERFLHTTPPATPASPLVALAELFLKQLNNVGQMSKQELIDMAVREGFFPDSNTAAQGVHPMLVSMLRSELIRETSDGIYMPPTFSQTIKLRRVT
jgi:hypothetical protein